MTFTSVSVFAWMSRVWISPWICWFSLMQIENLDQTYSPFNGGWLHGDDLPWDRSSVKKSPNKNKSKSFYEK